MKVTEEADGETERWRDRGTAEAQHSRKYSSTLSVSLSLRLSVPSSLRLNSVDQDFVDAATIHVHHLDSQTVPDEMIGGRGQSSEVSHDESRQRVVTAFFCSWRPLDQKRRHEVRDPHAAAEHPGPVFTLDGEAFAPSEVGRHFAAYRFQPVVHRHQPFQRAVFIDDQGTVRRRSFEQ